MKIGLITVRNREYHPNRRLWEAASARGHEVILIHPYNLWPAFDDGNPLLLGLPDPIDLDVVLPRQGATIGDSCLPLIRHFGIMGIPVVNDFDAVRLAKNQFFTLMTLSEALLPIPDSVFINSTEGLRNAVTKMGGYPVVIKPISGRQGEGVRIIESSEALDAASREFLERRKGILVQRFIPTKGRQDIRVLIVGGKVLGAMELRPKEGDFRANYHLTGASYAIDLPAELEGIALKAVDAMGLEIAGVDLIVDREASVYVIEVNYSPGFRGLESTTGLDIAGQIVSYLASTYGEGSL